MRDQTGGTAKPASRAGALARHRVPVIDRMAEVLFLLERRPAGATITELVGQLRLPRTSLYRILNTLQFHGIVRRPSNGAYSLGPRLLALAAHAVDELDLPTVADQHLRRLALETGEACKLSVSDGGMALVVAAVEGGREYALSVSPGQRFPFHAGAASKVLMAHLPERELAAILAAPFRRFTPKTLIDKRRIELELAKIRRQGWAQDDGEFAPSVLAFGAPVVDGQGRVIAAVSVPLLAGVKATHFDAVRLAVVAAAKAISAAAAGPAASARPPRLTVARARAPGKRP